MEEKYIFIIGGQHLEVNKVINLLSNAHFKIHYFTNYFSSDLFEISKKRNVEIFEIDCYENMVVNHFYLGGIFLNRVPENLSHSSFLGIPSVEIRNCINENMFFHLGFMKSILKQKKTKNLRRIFFVKFDFNRPNFNSILENIYNVLISFAKLEFEPIGVRLNQVNLDSESLYFGKVLREILLGDLNSTDSK